MRCRTVGRIITFILGVFLAPLAADAQRPAKIPRIGVLAAFFSSRPPPDLEASRAGLPPLGYEELEAFRQGLRDLGYVEGQSIALEYRLAEGQLERLPELAAELVRLKVDIIVAADGIRTVQTAQRATEAIPIVFPAAPNPVEQGLVASLARPGGNTTGLSFSGLELNGKRLELLKAAVPGITRVAYLWTHAGPCILQEIETAAHALGVQLQPVEVRDPYPFDQAFAIMAEMHADALMTHQARCSSVAVQSSWTWRHGCGCRGCSQSGSLRRRVAS
jgi:putative tryptophan/tyrosine transport system substrate-binding protein